MVSFLKEVMCRRKRLPSQLAADLGVSPATVSRWLSGRRLPSTKSYRRLAEYSGVLLEKVLSHADRRIAERDDNRYQIVGELRKRGLTFTEIGARLGISRQRAHQIYHGKASSRVLKE